MKDKKLTIDFERTPPVVLTVAGSDSGGCAGIQADLKTFAFHGVHGTSAITCVTAQNTSGVSRVDALSPEAIVAQLASVTEDMTIEFAKTGMLLNSSITEAVVRFFESYRCQSLVVDPVMVSRSGDQLLDDDAVAVIKSRLIPLANILTPNRYEAELLTGNSIGSIEEMKRAGQAIVKMGAHAVLVKGGGMPGAARAIDVWCDGQDTVVLETEVVETQNTNGTGCSLSAAIAANQARGASGLAACRAAKEYVTRGLKASLDVGQGRGPICHFPK